MSIDIEFLSKSISDDHPSGEDLDENYDPKLYELGEVAKGKSADAFGNEAEEPSWLNVQDLSLGLLAR
ncbi:MAG: hypothetical protein AAF492_13430, partial [Verrucomicrobiota bacterium]